MATDYATGLEAKRDAFTVMLEGMTKQELVKYGIDTYGLSLSAKFSKPDLENAIKDAASKFKLNEQIRVGVDLKHEEVPAGFAEIQIHRTDSTKKSKSAIVGLNGKFASLPIGAPFWCPLEFVEILNNAVQIAYDQDISVNPPVLVERAVHSYPFTVHRISPHTPASLARVAKLRGLRGRSEGDAQKAREARLNKAS